MQDLEIIKVLLQMGAAGLLMLAGWYFIGYLAGERKDRADERKLWFDRLESLSTGIEEALKCAAYECPIHGLTRQGAAEMYKRFLNTLRDPKDQK
jgi:hypothetical protein